MKEESLSVKLTKDAIATGLLTMIVLLFSVLISWKNLIGIKYVAILIVGLVSMGASFISKILIWGWDSE